MKMSINMLPSCSDDVRSSLDLLDGVIGEFDEGLTSSAESEANHGRGRARGGEDRVRPELRSSHASINEQIDDIFSQLTEEIYLDDKKAKENKIRLSRSPTRNRFDPLPPPPVSSGLQPPHSGSSSSTHPPPIDRKKKPEPGTKHSSGGKYGPGGGGGARAGGGGGQRMGDTKTLTNEKPRSKVSGVKTDRHNFSLPHDKVKSGNGEVILYEDHVISNTMEKVVADVHKTADYSKRSHAPPPMPEKQKIHLKNSSIDRNKETSKSFVQRQKNMSSQEAAVIQELKAKVSDKQGKISKFDNSRQHQSNQRTRSNLRDKEGNLRPGKRSQVQGGPRLSSPQSGSSQKSNPYVSMTDKTHAGAAERKINHNRDDYRRSRSMGPLEDKSYLRQRSRSRGFHDPSPDRSSSRPARHLNSADRTRSKSRGGGGRHESFNSGSRGGERGRAPARSRHSMASPPTPAEAEETIAALLPRWVTITYLLLVSVSIVKASMLDHHLKKLKSPMSALSIRSHVPPLYLNLIKMYCVHSLQRITSHDMRDSMVQVSQLCHSFPATVVNMETLTLNLSCQVSPWTTPREAEKHD